MHLSFCVSLYPLLYLFFFFNDTATTEIYTLSLHDALPISRVVTGAEQDQLLRPVGQKLEQDVVEVTGAGDHVVVMRSEEHTSELQSRRDLVCRLLLEKKKKKKIKTRSQYTE